MVENNKSKMSVLKSPGQILKAVGLLKSGWTI